MARRRRYEDRPKPEMIWTPCHGGFQVASGAKSPTSIKLCDLSPPDTELQWTHERTRGDLIFKMSASPAQPPLGWVSGIVLPDIVYGSDDGGTRYDSDNNSGRIPPKVGDTDGTDDFPVAVSFCAPPGVNQFIQQLDIKSRRKVGKDQLINVFLEIVDAVTGSQTTFGALTISYLLRTLWRRRNES